MTVQLAIDGGTPVRSELLPYGRQWISEDDISAVVEVLRSDLLTTGPRVNDFEKALAAYTGAGYAVAVSNGTAALHAAVHSLGVGPGDEIIIPTMTFCATASGVLFEGATPVFADVDPGTLLIDPAAVEELISERTRGVISVDFTGHPCDYDRLFELCERHGLALIDDASHALGALYRGRPIGSIADLTTFSFHPVKPITSGEGGMITTGDGERAGVMRRFRNHNISKDSSRRETDSTWHYDVTGLGWNYRLTDLQGALALNQLARLPGMLDRRRGIAGTYHSFFREFEAVEPLAVSPEVDHAWHLFVVRLDTDQLSVDREQVYRALRAEGIGVNVHYIPVHLHPWYQERLGTTAGLCPVAEDAYEKMLTLPLFPRMSDADVESVMEAVSKVIDAYRR